MNMIKKEKKRTKIFRKTNKFYINGFIISDTINFIKQTDFLNRLN